MFLNGSFSALRFGRLRSQSFFEINDLCLSSCDCLGKLGRARNHGLALRDEIFITLPFSGERKTNLVYLFSSFVFPLCRVFPRSFDRIAPGLLLLQASALCSQFLLELRNALTRCLNLLRESRLFRPEMVDLLVVVLQFSFEDDNSIFGSGLFLIGSPVLNLGLLEIILRFLQSCACFATFLQQCVALVADIGIFCTQHRNPRFAFEQGFGRGVTAAAKDNSFR